MSKDAVKKKAGRLGLKRPKPKDAPKDDLATRLADLQGLSPEDEEKPEPLRDEALRRFVDDPPALFAWLGVDLHPYSWIECRN